MSDRSTERDENGEELIDDSGRNATQRELDDRSGDPPAETPAPAPWGSGEDDSV